MFDRLAQQCWLLQVIICLTRSLPCCSSWQQQWSNNNNAEEQHRCNDIQSTMSSTGNNSTESWPKCVFKRTCRYYKWEIFRQTCGSWTSLNFGNRSKHQYTTWFPGFLRCHDHEIEEPFNRIWLPKVFASPSTPYSSTKVLYWYWYLVVLRKVRPKHISRRSIWPKDCARQPGSGWWGAKFLEEG